MKAARKDKGSLKILRLDAPRLLLALLLLAGLGLRMVDLTDPPLDFHPTRQYRGALVARSLYYQLAPSEDPARQARALAGRSQVAELEPPILEGLVALGYLVLGGEQLWVARVLVAFIWLLGGWALYAAVQRANGAWAALLATAFYLFLPFGVYASRSFQPDPLMVALMALAAYAALKWADERSWKWALLTGVAAGLALLVKAVALYFLGGMLAALVLGGLGWRGAVRSRQVGAMAGIALLPAVLYYAVNLGQTSSSYIQNWMLALLPLAYEPGFYVRWLSYLGNLFGLAAVFGGLIGIVLAGRTYRRMLLGLWAGYAAYGVTLPHQTLTHNYYHLPLLLILALSLGPPLQLLVEAVGERERRWAFAGLALVALAYNGWVARSTLIAEDHRHEPAYWERVGEAVPQGGQTIGLVQHYGHALSYYGWRTVALWPVTAELRLAELRGSDIGEFEAAFLERTAGMDYFLVTSFNQLEQQAQLGDYLHAHYPVFSEGPGYLIFDLRAVATGEG